ncbi:MAG: TrkH family potassium uptake protein, partial [Clostridia bacterium]|nr:TrkH family potassium uptake protein [Clostridia bacterium]
MRYQQIIYILGHVLRFNGLFLCLPLLCAVIYGEQSGIITFAVTALLSFISGCIFSFKKPQNHSLYARDGFVIVSLAWLVMGLIGAIPISILGNTSYINGVFEAVSGFTTTGASVFSSVEDLPKCVLMWRSFTHWVGGMGVLVFIISILPLSGGYNMNIMKAESPGPSVGKLVPNIRKTASILYIIYISLTALELIFLLIGKMTFFDALNTAFATAGTGGF